MSLWTAPQSPNLLLGPTASTKFMGFSLKKSAIGDIHKVITAWDYLYRDWLIKSAYEPEHAPALNFFWSEKRHTLVTL